MLERFPESLNGVLTAFWGIHTQDVVAREHGEVIGGGLSAVCPYYLSAHGALHPQRVALDLEDAIGFTCLTERGQVGRSVCFSITGVRRWHPQRRSCLRQQGTLPIYYRRFSPGRAKIVDNKEERVPRLLSLTKGCRRPRPRAVYRTKPSGGARSHVPSERPG
jgi:hypothetical protein